MEKMMNFVSYCESRFKTIEYKQVLDPLALPLLLESAALKTLLQTTVFFGKFFIIPRVLFGYFKAIFGIGVSPELQMEFAKNDVLAQAATQAKVAQDMLANVTTIKGTKT